MRRKPLRDFWTREGSGLGSLGKKGAQFLRSPRW
jgi:hypothetical protein